MTESVILYDGSVYTGEFFYNNNNFPVLHGKGSLVSVNGYKYEGHFNMGLMHGKITVTYLSKEESVIIEYDHGKLVIN